MKITYPYCMLDGNLVNIKDAKHGNKYLCVECDKPMIPKLGKIKIHHFAHRFIGNCNPDNTLHETSKLHIRNLFNKAKQNNKNLIISIPCIKCKHNIDYTLQTGGNIKNEYSVIDRTRSDLVILNKDGSTQAIIETIVTHDLEPQTHELYSQSKIPIIKIKPTWNNLIKVNQTMNINKMCNTCKEFEAKINIKINEKTVGWWVKSEKSNCWGIHTTNLLVTETDVVNVVAKTEMHKLKNLGVRLNRINMD